MKRIILISTILILFAVSANANDYLYGISQLSSDIQVYDVVTGTLVNEFSTDTTGFPIHHYGSITFGPDGYLYGRTEDTDPSGAIKAFDVATGELVREFIPTNFIDSRSGLAFGPDGYLYGISQLSSDIQVYDVVTGTLVNEFSTDTTGFPIHHYGSITFGPDGYLYGRTEDTDPSGAIKAFDVATGELVREFIPTNFIDSRSGLAFQSTIVPEPISSILFITGGATFGLRRYIRKRI